MSRQRFLNVKNCNLPTTDPAAAIAAFNSVASVFTHPRCTNCHVSGAPLRNDGQAHFTITQSDAINNEGTTFCAGYHSANPTNPNLNPPYPTSGTWRQPVAAKAFANKTAAQICNGILANLQVNGNRSPEVIADHLDDDGLVQWGWNPVPTGRR